MKIKRFNEINEINEDNNQYRDTKLVILIDDNGNKINKKGYTKEGIGIFDYEANEYPAGIDEHGNVYASQVIGDDILQLNGEDIVPGIKMGETYKSVHEHFNDLDADRIVKWMNDPRYQNFSKTVTVDEPISITFDNNQDWAKFTMVLQKYRIPFKENDNN